MPFKDVSWTCPWCGTDFVQADGAETGFVFGRQDVTCLACGEALSEEEFVAAYRAGKKRRACFAEGVGCFCLPAGGLPVSAEAREILRCYPQFRDINAWSEVDLYDLAWLASDPSIDRNALPLEFLPLKEVNLLLPFGVRFPLLELAEKVCRGVKSARVAMANQLRGQTGSLTLPDLLLTEKYLSFGDPAHWLKLLNVEESFRRLSAIVAGLLLGVLAFKEKCPERVAEGLAKFSRLSKFLCQNFVAKKDLGALGVKFSESSNAMKVEVISATACSEFRVALMRQVPSAVLVEWLVSGNLKISLSDVSTDLLTDEDCLKLVLHLSDPIGGIPEPIAARAIRLYPTMSLADWRCVCQNSGFQWTKEVCEAFAEAFVSGRIPLSALGDLVREYGRVAQFVPFEKLQTSDIVSLIVQTDSDAFWKEGLRRGLSAEDWKRIVRLRRRMVSSKYLGGLAQAKGMTSAIANAILGVDMRYVRYLSLDVVSRERIMDLLIAGNDDVWRRFDFGRLEREELLKVLWQTDYSGEWPKSLVACLASKGNPLSFEDVCELCRKYPDHVVAAISVDWICDVPLAAFEDFVKVATASSKGLAALRERFASDVELGNVLPQEKRLTLLKIEPSLRDVYSWRDWPLAKVHELIESNDLFRQEFTRPIAYFFWRYAKQVAVLAAVFVALVGLTVKEMRDAAAHDRHCRMLNSCVQRVLELDQKRDYETLRTYWANLSAGIQSEIEPDLFVRKARRNQITWEENREKLEAPMAQLHALEASGWGTCPKKDVDALLQGTSILARLVGEESRAEVERLKDRYAAYCSEEAEKKTIQDWGVKLAEIQERAGRGIAVAELEVLKREALGCPSKAALEKQKSEVLVQINERIEAFQIVAISNEVRSVAATLRAMKSIDDFSGITNRFEAIARMPRFEKFFETPSMSEYDALADDVRSLCMMQDVLLRDRQQVAAFVEKARTSLLLRDDRTICSNVVSECTAVVSATNAWPVWVTAFKEMKDKVDVVVARDDCCRGLIAKLNATRDYAAYLSVRNVLLAEFGELRQLAPFKSLPIVPAEHVRLRFAGVIRLDPDSVSVVYVDVDNDKLASPADLYCYAVSESGELAPFCFFQLDGSKVYMTLDKNFDYTCWQGAPLFVSEAQYLGRRRRR